MDISSAIFLGILQGLTEFLPVSSSGHLVIAQSLIPGFSQPSILFDVIVHTGTLFAVLFFFRKKIFKLTKKYLLILLIGTIPAAFVGLFLDSYVEPLFESVKVVGLALLITGIFNLLVDKLETAKEKISKKESFIVGLFQAFAIIPGISRSGSTIFASSKLGIKRKEAAEFSFLLSVPAVAGATFLELFETGSAIAASYSFYIVGFLFSFIAGYFAIKIVFSLLIEKRFKLFGYYCLLLGVTTLVFL